MDSEKLIKPAHLPIGKFFLLLRSSGTMCGVHLSTSGPPSHIGGEEKSCGCENGGLRDESFVCTTCCDRCDSLFDVKCSCHSKLFTKADSKELITSNARGKECLLQKCTHRTP